jgi:acetamidase/formamidase
MSDPQVLAFRPSAEQFAWTFGGVAPVARIEPGTILELFTEDCFAGRVRGKDDLVSRVCEFPFLNPHVWMWELDRAAGLCRFTARDSDFTADLPMNPMHGTVGVAPANLEVRSALVPDAFGGNMDTPEMRAGVTCYLGVNVAGGLMSIGDGHARQGEGETCGVAVECAMNTVLAVDLIKGVPTPWPRLESDTHIMSTGSVRPLEDAFRIAQADLVQWVSELTGLSMLDAYQFISQSVEAPLANVVDTNYTAVAKLRKDWLPGRSEVMRGCHDRLREIARAYRGG